MKKIYLFLFFSSTLSCFCQNKTEKYIIKYKDMAIIEMKMYSIPASITLAQAILESGNGESRLAKKGNNHFGIKCHNNWNGKTIIEDDDNKGECFRKYDRISDSYRDHSLFLTERGRYSFLFEYSLTDYKAWAKGLKKAGYATNPRYPQLLIDLIEKYNLNKYDKSIEIDNSLSFAHSYGVPYFSGLGIYYFKNRSFYFTEINTSFIFSDAMLGYSYTFLNNFYVGSSTGIIFLPSEGPRYIPCLSLETMYKRENRKTVLFRGGIQIPLSEISLFNDNFSLLPYLRMTFLLN